MSKNNAKINSLPHDDVETKNLIAAALSQPIAEFIAVALIAMAALMPPTVAEAASPPVTPPSATSISAVSFTRMSDRDAVVAGINKRGGSIEINALKRAMRNRLCVPELRTVLASLCDDGIIDVSAETDNLGQALTFYTMRRPVQPGMAQ